MFHGSSLLAVNIRCKTKKMDLPHAMDRRVTNGQDPGGFWPRRFLIVLLALILVPWSGVVQSAPFQSETVQRSGTIQQTETVPSTERIDALVKLLGDPSFAVRQSATDQLWRIGTAAIPVLRQAAEHPDPETANRAKQILSLLSVGVDANSGSETIELVLKFHETEAGNQVDILKLLMRTDQLELVFRLLERVEDLETRDKMFDKVVDLDDTVIRLSRINRWDEIEFMLSHPLTLAHEPAVAIHFHLASGTISQLTDRLKQSIGEGESKQESVDDQLIQLISLYRLQRQFETAESLIERIADGGTSQQLANQILLEKGDWPSVASKMVIRGGVLPGPDQIGVTTAQAALVYQWTNNSEGYKRVVDGLNQELVQRRQANDPDGAKLIRTKLLEIGLANLDWPLVEANLDRDNVQQTFNIYLDHQRIDQAFEFVGFTGDVVTREKWLQQKLSEIKKLSKQISKLRQKNEDADEATAELNGKWQLCLDVADRLATLGMTDESLLHCLTLFAAMPEEENQTRRAAIVGRLIVMEKFDEAWQLIEHGFAASEMRQVVRYFFPSHQRTAAAYWQNVLMERYPDGLDRLKVVSGMLNSPMGTFSDFSLDLELAAASTNPNLNAGGYLDYQIATILEYHGQFEKSLKHLQLAEQLGSDPAKRTLAQRAFEESNFERAVELYEGAWKYRTSAMDTCLAAETNRRLGRMRKAVLQQCVAYAYWRDSYQNAATISGLEILGQAKLIKDFLKLDVYGLDGNGISNDRYRYDLAAAEVEQSPMFAATEKQIVLFNQSDRDEPGSQFAGFWSESRKQINVALAAGMIEAGELERAVDLLIQCNDFTPGDPGLAEDIVKKLDLAGGNRPADRLFGNLATFYTDLFQNYPDSPLHHNNYAWLCVCSNRRSDAMLRHAEKAVSLRPNSSSYLDTLATIVFERGQKQRAVKLSRRCVELNPVKRHYRDQMRKFESN